jgi:hypothetical protein
LKSCWIREEQLNMKALLSGIALAALVVSLPAWSQANAAQTGASIQSTQHEAANMPNSEPGVPGRPGTKSGPTVTPSGKVTGKKQPADARLRDESGVRGLPGNKSGVAVTPSNKK